MAVQTARMSDGGEETVRRLYEEYCGWLAQPYGPAHNSYDELIDAWINEHLQPGNSPKKQEQASRLYHHFKKWFHSNGESKTPSVKRFGSRMKERFDTIKSNVSWYLVEFV